MLGPHQLPRGRPRLIQPNPRLTLFTAYFHRNKKKKKDQKRRRAANVCILICNQIPFGKLTCKTVTWPPQKRQQDRRESQIQAETITAMCHPSKKKKKKLSRNRTLCNHLGTYPRAVCRDSEVFGQGLTAKWVDGCFSLWRNLSSVYSLTVSYIYLNDIMHTIPDVQYFSSSVHALQDYLRNK